jgi:hypothetical protein
MPQNHSKTAEVPAPAAPVVPIAAVAVLGASTAMGKSTFSDALESFFRSAGVAVHTARIETGRRRGEFLERNSFIDLDTAANATHEIGGEASLLDGLWPRMKAAMRGGHVVVIDCGAGAEKLLLNTAGSTGLAGLVAARGARFWVVVVTTPELESARQAATLVDDVHERMPHADVLLAVNCVSPTQKLGLDTPQGRAVAAILETLHVPRIEIPFCGAQGLTAFADSQRTFIEILSADEEQLARWSRKGELASLAAQTHLAAWWQAICDQLSRLWNYDAPNR